MIKSQSERKGCSYILFFLLLVFLGCSSSCPHWIYDDVCTPCGLYNSGRMVLPPSSPCANLEIEIRRGLSGTHVYLNAFSLPIPHLLEDPSKARVTITVCDTELTVIGDLLEGGQRLILPGDASKLIIDALLDNQCVNISTGAYKAEIIPTRFHKHYEELNRIPIPIPFQEE